MRREGLLSDVRVGLEVRPSRCAGTVLLFMQKQNCVRVVFVTMLRSEVHDALLGSIPLSYRTRGRW